MVPLAHPFRLEKRQTPLDALPTPSTAAGITNAAVTVDTAGADTASSLAFDASVTPDGTGPTAANFTPAPTSTIIQSSSTTPVVDDPTSSSVDAASASSKPIALSTVIGTCVGAFIGAAAFIALALWFYRRYSASLKRKAARAPFIHGRNLNGEHQRRRSHLQPWDKLEDGEDKWEDMYQTKEVDQVAPMEKLTMFKKSTPSVRTAYTQQDDTQLDFPPSFAPFDPKLAQSLNTRPPMPEPRPFMGRVDAQPVISWDTTDSVAKESYLTARSRMSGGAVSPTLNMAIPTPQATSSPQHRWESAEVVHYAEGQTAEIHNPFTSEDDDNRKSIHNPFFNAQDYTPQPRSRSNSVRSRSNSISQPKSTKAKGKERMRYSKAEPDSDPFAGEDLPPPRIIHHAATASTTSVESKEHALQSLMAALEISEDEVRDRLRVASMQPSIISQASMYTDGGEDVTKAFPLPPTFGSNRS